MWVRRKSGRLLLTAVFLTGRLLLSSTGLLNAPGSIFLNYTKRFQILMFFPQCRALVPIFVPSAINRFYFSILYFDSGYQLIFVFLESLLDNSSSFVVSESC